MNELPKTDRFSLRDAMSAVDRGEQEDHTANSIADKIGDAKKREIAERDLRRADALEAMLRARGHSERASEPVTALQASVAWSIADLLHLLAAEKKVYAEAPGSVSTNATGGANSVKSLDPSIEQGIAATSGEGS